MFMATIDEERAACYQAAYTKGYQAGLRLIGGETAACPYRRNWGSRAFRACWLRGLRQALEENE